MSIKYLTDEIGDSYKNWKPGDEILITAHTGTGKTWFVLYELLKWVIFQKGKMLYLVNRKILKLQLEEKLKDEIEKYMRNEFPYERIDINDYITIATYQSLETEIKASMRYRNNESYNKMNQYTILVCDEAHYFYSDSNFNTNTILSFNNLRIAFYAKIQVYMSATLDNMRSYLVGENNSLVRNKELDNNFIMHQTKRMGQLYEYGMEKNYDNINLVMFNGLEDLRDIIIREVTINKEKWLIFVDDIMEGRSLKKSLTTKKKPKDKDDKKAYADEDNIILSDEDIVFIKAGYEKDEDATKSVQEITKKSLSKKSVIITTPVMDNGISIYDPELLNIAIVADTEEEFIQMLGRQRFSSKQINVFISRKSQSYFDSRYKEVNEAIRFCNQHMKNLNVICKYTGALNSWDVNGYLPNIYQQELLEKIFQYPICYKYIRKVCFAINGLIGINTIAYNRLYNLSRFYDEMAYLMADDSFAFARQQAKWLSKSDDEIKKYIVESIEIHHEKLRKAFEGSIKAWLKQEEKMIMDKSENIRFKMDVRDYLIYFYEYGEMQGVEFKTQKSSIGQNDRVISVELFNDIMHVAELPYLMSKDKRMFVLTKIDLQ